MEKYEALEKLNRLLKDIEELKKGSYKEEDPELDKYINRGVRYLNKIFTESNDYKERFSGINYFSMTMVISSAFGDNRGSKYREDNEAYHTGLIEAQTLIESAIEEVEEEWEGIESTVQIASKTIDKSKVLIVHGHEEAPKQAVARLLERLGLQPIILHEQPSKGMTIIEKIEHYSSDVGYGIVLYTECDLGKAKEEEELKPRARQNVVFEHGLLCALIKRENVVAFKIGNVEKPSDIDGVLYKPMDDHGAWKYSLVDEFNAVGYNLSKDSI